MSGARESEVDDADLATVVAARVVGGHDGAAELALVLSYIDGVDATVVLDAQATFAVMVRCGLDTLDDLVGRSWRDVLSTGINDPVPAGIATGDEGCTSIPGLRPAANPQSVA